VQDRSDTSELAESQVRLLEAIPDPALVLDSGRVVLAANRPARELLGADATGRDLALSLRHPEALAAVAAVLQDAGDHLAEIVMPVPMERSFRIHAAALVDDLVEGARALVVMREVTDLREAEKMRVDFVANVSHELRSPLSSLVGFIETLKGPARDDADARHRFLDIMDTEAQRMARLVDDLLSLSRVEVSEHVRPTEPVDLTHVLKEVIDSLSGVAAERRMAIELDCPPRLPAVAGDTDELVQVFQNLADNALKYGREGTPVAISVAPVTRIPDVGGTGLAVRVADRGEGISPGHLARLTERFYRVDKGRSRSLGGTGLGLAIVKHIINRHRGRLTIESEEGEGATFTVYLPLAATEGAPGAVS
jgi:two-component system phosphate regulon sensor histidine kinase PhoR